MADIEERLLDEDDVMDRVTDFNCFVQSKYYSTAQGVVLPSCTRKSAYLYSKTRDFDHSFSCMLVSYRTRTVWDVFQCLHNVADKDLSAKPLY